MGRVILQPFRERQGVNVPGMRARVNIKKSWHDTFREVADVTDWVGKNPLGGSIFNAIQGAIQGADADERGRKFLASLNAPPATAPTAAPTAPAEQAGPSALVPEYDPGLPPGRAFYDAAGTSPMPLDGSASPVSMQVAQARQAGPAPEFPPRGPLPSAGLTGGPESMVKQSRGKLAQLNASVANELSTTPLGPTDRWLEMRQQTAVAQGFPEGLSPQEVQDKARSLYDTYNAQPRGFAERGIDLSGLPYKLLLALAAGAATEQQRAELMFAADSAVGMKSTSLYDAAQGGADTRLKAEMMKSFPEAKGAPGMKASDAIAMTRLGLDAEKQRANSALKAVQAEKTAAESDQSWVERMIKMLAASKQSPTSTTSVVVQNRTPGPQAKPPEVLDQERQKELTVRAEDAKRRIGKVEEDRAEVSSLLEGFDGDIEKWSTFIDTDGVGAGPKDYAQFVAAAGNYTTQAEKLRQSADKQKRKYVARLEKLRMQQFNAERDLTIAQLQLAGYGELEKLLAKLYDPKGKSKEEALVEWMKGRNAYLVARTGVLAGQSEAELMRKAGYAP